MFPQLLRSQLLTVCLSFCYISDDLLMCAHAVFCVSSASMRFHRETAEAHWRVRSHLYGNWLEQPAGEVAVHWGTSRVCIPPSQSHWAGSANRWRSVNHRLCLVSAPTSFGIHLFVLCMVHSTPVWLARSKLVTVKDMSSKQPFVCEQHGRLHVWVSKRQRIMFQY